MHIIYNRQASVEHKKFQEIKNKYLFVIKAPKIYLPTKKNEAINKEILG